MSTVAISSSRGVSAHRAAPSFPPSAKKDLPQELVRRIGEYLDPETLNNFRSTSKFMRDLLCIFPRVPSLNLSGLRIQDRALLEIAKAAYPDLIKLDLSGCTDFTSAGQKADHRSDRHHHR